MKKKNRKVRVVLPTKPIGRPSILKEEIYVVPPK